MAIYRVKDKWRAEAHYGGRRLGTKLFKTQREARVWLEETRGRWRRGEDGAKVTTAFDEVIKRFEEDHLPTLRFASRRAYRTHLEKRIKPYFRFFPLAKVTPGLIERFKMDLMAKVKSPKTINDTLDLLRLILNQAVGWRLIRATPFESKRLRIPKGEPRGWEAKGDVAKFLSASRSSRYHLAYWLTLETGLRYGEVAGLHWSDIDFETGAIKVERQWVEANYDYGPTKDGETRVVSFNPEGEFAEALRLGKEQATSEIFAATRSGRHPTKTQLAGRAFKRIQEKAKVPGITFHGLRHTFAGFYIDWTGNVEALQRILGHADIRTTMIYLRRSRRYRPAPLEITQVITQNPHTRPTLKAVGGCND